MDICSSVTVHESAFPAAIRERIASGLRRRELDPSLLYGGLRQATRWIELHQAFSPVHRNVDLANLYRTAFSETAQRCQGNVVHVVSLACGDGGKDTECLRAARLQNRTVIYTPVDFSTEMALTAEQTATSALKGLQCTPLVCELLHCTVLPGILKNFDPSGAERIILFLGTIHNYWPPEILRSVLYALRSQDQLLIGANLAPTHGYEEALRGILTQYDNDLTRRWLEGALAELSLGSEAGRIEFSLAPADELAGLKRIQADFIFNSAKTIRCLGEVFEFERDAKLRLFYSYRFTIEHLRAFFTQAKLALTNEWIDPAGSEGLFLCRRADSQKT